MPSKEVKLTGTVVSGRFGEGTKSAHAALQLQTDEGSFVLRRKGGNPFEGDADLKKLEGKTVTAVGTIRDYIFVATDVKETD